MRCAAPLRRARDRRCSRSRRSPACSPACSRRSFFRYFLGDPLTWSDELARYLFVWCAFLGWIIAARRRSHLAIDDRCRSALPPRAQRGAARARRRARGARLRRGPRLLRRADRAAQRSTSTRRRCSSRWASSTRSCRSRRSPSGCTRWPTRARRCARLRGAPRSRAMIDADARDPRGVVRRAVRRAGDLRGDGARRLRVPAARRASRASSSRRRSRWRPTRSRCSPRRCSS